MSYATIFVFVVPFAHIPIVIEPGTHGFSVLPIAIGMSYATGKICGANLKKKIIPQNFFNPNMLNPLRFWIITGI